MSRQFDRFMVDVAIGTNRKLRRLPVVERWVYVAGVLSIAAQSPMRGALLITDGEAATASDIAAQATVPVRHARSTLASLTRLGMLDEDAEGVLWVHDWDKINPEPKPSDSPAATRERKRRQREAQRQSVSVTRDLGVTPPQSHAPEVEGGKLEVGSTPQPPQAGGRQRTRLAFDEEVKTYTVEVLGLTQPDAWQNVRHAIQSVGARTNDEVLAWIEKWRPDLLEQQEAAA